MSEAGDKIKAALARQNEQREARQQVAQQIDAASAASVAAGGSPSLSPTTIGPTTTETELGQ